MLEDFILLSHQFTEYGARNCPELSVSEKIVFVAPAAQPTPDIMSRNGT